MIHDYNNGMGGVDLMDQNKQYYEFDRKSKTKFYLKPFYDLIDISVLNAVHIYGRIQESRPNLPPYSHFEFRRYVARGLTAGYRSRQRATGRTSMVERSLPRPQIAHVPVLGPSKRRCVLCAQAGVEKRTSYSCKACGKALCVTDRQCFARFHT